MQINTNQIFQEIQQKYEELGHDLGWRFLGTSVQTLSNNSSIALITLNPGGNKYVEPKLSFEEGNIYMHEDWKGKGKGQEPLQQQIQYLFEELVYRHPGYDNYVELMNESLMGYYIPFRSSRSKYLLNYELSRDFAYDLWEKILKSVNLSLIICVGIDNPYPDIQKILTNLYNNEQEKTSPAGWGKYHARIMKFIDEGRNITLAGLPHLSTFRIFNRTESKKEINKIIAIIRKTNLKNHNFLLPGIIFTQAHNNPLT